MGFKWRVGIAVLGVTLTSCLFRASAVTDDLDATVPSSSPAAPAGSRFVGTSSCSARACHGSVEQPAAGAQVLQNEYITWITRDKRHADAYATLLKDRSKQIAKNLAGGGKIVHAHQDPRCLACHSVPALASDPAESAALLRDGVSCEACHGPAKDWLTEHTSLEWRKKNPKQKQQMGMMPTRELDKRAELCVGCHVGAPPDNQSGTPVRDAFHDIMAAGHPRLNFEFGAFLESMPKHWKHSIDEGQGPDFEVRAWAIGQVATTRAALDLLVLRAGDEERPWPEFAEYDCFACHHDLRASKPSKNNAGGLSWQQLRGYSGRTAGSLTWGTWYLPMTGLLAKAQPPHSQQLLSSLSKLEKLMNPSRSDPPFPDREIVAKLARSTSGMLDVWLNELSAKSHDPRELRRLLADWAKEGEAIAQTNWDAAAQLYLALVALNRTIRDEQIETALESIRRELSFPECYESPKDFRKNFDPNQVDPLGAQLRRIHEKVGP